MVRPKSPLRLDWVDPAVCSLDYRLKIIGRLPFFRSLPPEAVARINARFHDFDAPAESWIYHEGDPAGAVYLVATGKVKLIRHAISGREALLDVLHGGEIFGLDGVIAGRSHQETAAAQTDCCILKISSTDFDWILQEYPAITRNVLSVFSQRLAESQAIIEQLSSFTVEQRIAAALLRLAAKLGEARGPDVLIQLPFSRQDLAAMTGTTPETVSRVMSRFSDEGWIATGRKWVTLTGTRRLEELVKSGAVN